MADFAAVLEDVTVAYPSPHGTVKALSNVTARFRRGSSTAVVGRSGSGKSTLISVLSLLRRPTAGRVRLGEVVASELTARETADFRATMIGIVFQSFHLEPSLTAAENVMLPWYFGAYRCPGRLARRRAADILDQLGIGELAGRHPHAMSGGQRQRVAIGRGLFTKPALLVADEPTGNLDEETANSVAATIFSLPELFGTTVVAVTHDPAVARSAQARLELVQGELQVELGGAP